MQDLKPLEPGVMFWADRDSMDMVRSLGVRCGQLGIPGDMHLDAAAADRWNADLNRDNFTVITVFAAFTGEDYADLPTVERTVGFIPSATRKQREQRMYAVSDFANRLGVWSIACHIGFVPEDTTHAEYKAMRDLVRRICDHAARHHQTFALETGQERALALLDFIRDVDRSNLVVNFDPANMILYGTGDPIDALETLGRHVVTVHCKDGDWPPADQPGALGTERPLGRGAVGMERFIAQLRKIGYAGPLTIEREAHDPNQRLQDIRMGIGLLQRLTA